MHHIDRCLKSLLESLQWCWDFRWWPDDRTSKQYVRENFTFCFKRFFSLTFVKQVVWAIKCEDKLGIIRSSSSQSGVSATSLLHAPCWPGLLMCSDRNCDRTIRAHKSRENLSLTHSFWLLKEAPRSTRQSLRRAPVMSTWALLSAWYKLPKLHSKLRAFLSLKQSLLTWKI